MKSLEISSKVVSSRNFQVDGRTTEAAQNGGKMVLKISDVHATEDGSVDLRGRPAIRELTGGWSSGILLLLNQGFAMLAFFGVGVNLVLFLTRVMQQSNAAAANSVSKWTGTVYIFSLVGAFLSDSYWGRYKTCAIFQAIFVVGLLLLSLSTNLFLIRPSGCGNEAVMCRPHTSLENALFYLSIYLIALGNGGYQPTIATFGADQFDEEHPKESHSKLSFFSYFYFALNLGSLFSNTILAYLEDSGRWSLGFWTSTGSATLALLLFLAGTSRYRHFKPSGNPLPRVLQVFTAAARKWNVEVPTSGEKLYELAGNESAISGCRKILHSDDLRFLDKAATVTSSELKPEAGNIDPWSLCTVTQVEEVKCVIKMLPIWLCTIIYSVVFTQMASLFVEQGTVMNTRIAGSFHIPAASMSVFDILSVLFFIFVYRKTLTPLAARFTGNPSGLTELQRMGTGLIIGMLAMVAAGVVELARLSKADSADLARSSSLSILWQIPQYSLIGASEVFMYVGQLEFFNGQAPDALKSFGSALCMASISFGNYVSSWLVSIVMWITTKNDSPGWIPGNLNHGHMDRFYFLLAGLAVVDFVVYLLCAKWYNYISFQSHISGEEDEELACQTARVSMMT